MNFLVEHGIDSYGELESRFADVTGERDAVLSSIKDMERHMADLTLVQKHAFVYCQSKNVEKFLRGHGSEIILFEASARELKKLGAVPLPSTEDMKKSLRTLLPGRRPCMPNNIAARSGRRSIEIIKQNVDLLLPVLKEQARRRGLE